MNKRYSIILILLIGWISAFAQSSMTDEQIINYVVSAKNSGKSETQIAMSLQERGVTLTRLKQIKERYDKGELTIDGEEITTSKKNTTSTDNRLRTPNDDTMQGLLKDWSLEDEEIDEEEEEDERRVFGRDIFNSKNLTFEPSMNVATPANYRLGAGDDVFIDVWGASQNSIRQTISPDGTIQLDGLGPVTLAGMTVASANAYLQRELKNVYASSNIRVTVGQTKTISVNVMGEVEAPGTYTLSAFATAFHALYVAGGVNDIGTLRDIKVYRNNKQVACIDVYDFILNGRKQDDVRLEDNDLVYVGPYAEMVEITGKVKRPMFYEMRQRESLATLLTFAGGFAGNAYKGNVNIIRKTGRDYSVHTVEEFDFSTFKMADGDSVWVDAIIPRYSNMVEVVGAVHRPGMYQMDGKIRTVRELVEYIGGVTEEAFLDRALLQRRKSDRTMESLALNLGGILNGSLPDVPLRNEDILNIFSNEEAQNERTFTIHGPVRNPGVYPFAENTTIEDVIMLAGGLKDEASMIHVDVARRIVENRVKTTGVERAKIFSFSLKDGLIVDGEVGFTLRPYDEIYIRRSPGYYEQQNVLIEGEVAFEGSYVLQTKNDRLSDLVKRAGGFTESAYVPGARLIRTMNQEEIARRNATLRLTRSSSDSIKVEDLDLSTTYSVGINLDEAMANPGGESDIMMREGDRLFIPVLQTTVKINGAVMYPNTVAWRDGQKLKYYIRQAGGYSKRALKKQSYVVNINGTVERARKVKRILPGSEIVVPLKEESEKLSTSEKVMIGTSIASLSTMVATIVSLFK